LQVSFRNQYARYPAIKKDTCYLQFWHKLALSPNAKIALIQVTITRRHRALTSNLLKMDEMIPVFFLASRLQGYP
jgi:hypothetical protein